jgi:hypothetical protein
MKINILTSCTGDKSTTHAAELALSDFQQGAEHVQTREKALAAYLRTAEAMYTGQQHLRLMDGVRAARARGAEVQVKVVSAGYGLIDGLRLIAPYNTTFNGMPARAFREWAQHLDIAEAVKQYLAGPADLTLILLGDRYLDASELHKVETLGATTIAFCGKSSEDRFGKGIKTIAFEQADTRRFGCNMIGLKGELAKRLLSSAELDDEWTLDRLANAASTARAQAIRSQQAALF